MDNITLKVDLVEEDLYKYQKSLLLKNLSSIPVGFAAAMLFLGFVLKPLLFDDFSIVEKACRVFLLFVVSAIIVIVVRNTLKRTSKTAFNSYKLLQKTQNYIINSDGVKTRSESGDSYIKWAELYSAFETKESFLLFISNSQAYLIPKRFLDEKSGELGILRKLVRNVPIPKKEKKSIKNKFLLGILIYAGIFFIILIMITIIQKLR